LPPRTLTQEIEFRLLRSFSEPDHLEKLLGGRTAESLFVVLANRLQAIQAESGRSWWEDRWTHEKCLEFMTAFFNEFRPKGRKIEPKWKPGPLAWPPKKGERPMPLPVSSHVMIARNFIENASEEERRPGHLTAAMLASKLGPENTIRNSAKGGKK
jgi:hypothetical protein